jgi:hypothetical protein
MTHTSHTSTKPAIVILGVTFVLIALSAFIPASWFGIQPQTTTKEYDLSMLSDTEVPDTQNPQNTTSNWRALLQKNYNEITSSAPELTMSDQEQQNTEKRLNDPNNLTSSFMKNSYAASAYLKENNITDETAQTEMIKSLVEQEKTKIVTKVYTIKDLHVASKENKTTIRNYGNALGVEMQKADKSKIGDTDVKDLQSYTDTKDPKYLITIQKKKDTLGANIKALLAMQVPPSATAYHLLALNKLSEYYTTLDGFSRTEDDPLRASIALNDYIANLRSLFGALNAMRGYFRDNNIVYSIDEPGYVFSSVNTTH